MKRPVKMLCEVPVAYVIKHFLGIPLYSGKGQSFKTKFIYLNVQRGNFSSGSIQTERWAYTAMKGIGIQHATS
jgi:hypothetical protein